MQQSTKPSRLPTFYETIEKEEKRQEAEKIVSETRATKKHGGTLEGLPVNLYAMFAAFLAKSNNFININALAHDIFSLASTSRRLKAILNTPETTVKIFNALPYTQNILDLAQILKKKLGTMSVMKNQEIKKWIIAAEKRLGHGDTLINATWDNNVAQVENLLKNKDLHLNWEYRITRVDNLSKGSIFHSNNLLGTTALNLSVFRGYKRITELLLQAGANPNIQDHNGLSPLINAALHLGQGKSWDDLLITLLHPPNVNLNVQDKFGRTALMLAAQNGSPEIVKLLLDAGAHRELMDKLRDTIVDYAFRNQNSGEILKVIAQESIEKKRKK